MPKARDVREWQGRRWERTEHNLDRVFEADGRAYGIEIKNTLKYIGRGELSLKIEMCQFLGLVPLFVMRFAPKVYNFEIIGAGVFRMGSCSGSQRGTTNSFRQPKRRLWKMSIWDAISRSGP
jgi:hypothetical protein